MKIKSSKCKHKKLCLSTYKYSCLVSFLGLYLFFFFNMYKENNNNNNFLSNLLILNFQNLSFNVKNNIILTWKRIS